MHKRINYIILLILFSGFGLQANAQQDSIAAYRYFQLFQEVEYSDSLKARVYSDSALFFAKRSKSNTLLGRAYQFKGWYYEDRSEFRKAKNEYLVSLEYYKRADFKQGIADAYGNLGNSFLDLGEIAQSLDYQLKSLRQNEYILSSKPNQEDKSRALEGKTYALHNIASIYADLDLHEKALEYERKSLKAELAAKRQIGAAISYCSIASSYKELGAVDSAFYYYSVGIEIFKREKYDAGLPSAYYALASLPTTKLTDSERAKLMLEALRIDQESGDRNGEVNGLLGLVEYRFNALTTDSLSRLLKRAEKLINQFDLGQSNERLFKLYSQFYERKGDYAKAFSFMKQHLALKELSDKEKKNQDILTADIKYEVQLKSYNDSLRLAESYELSQAKYQQKIAEQRTWISLGVLGGLILLGSLAFLIYANRRRRRLNNFLSEKNAVIRQQKEIVEEKNKAISSSIAYARRLQAAILPMRSEIEELFPDSFLIFKPKDVVSGDFYWCETMDDIIYIAAADCTGHGVPGAIVSVVCSNALSRVLKEFRTKEPSKILTQTRSLVIETFGRSDEYVEDGMDISFCAVDRKNAKVRFVGANNPLWIIRKSMYLENSIADKITKRESHILLEYKGNKQPVGPYPTMTDFTEMEIDLMEGDTIFMFSDGFSDQFGGADDKKFMASRLKDELLDRCDIPMTQLEKELEHVFMNWMGANEQVDDVCMIGVRIE